MDIVDVYQSLIRKFAGAWIWQQWRNELHNEELPEKWCNLHWGLVGK